MNELIVVDQMTIGQSEVNAVDGRELHAFLEVKDIFRSWLPRRIEEYGFTEDTDWCAKSHTLESGQKAKEYTLSLDMAKELSMVEKNEKGREARKYFIECEKRAKEGFDTELRAKLADMQMQQLKLMAELKRKKALKAPLKPGYYRLGVLAKEIGLTSKELSDDLFEMLYMISYPTSKTARFGYSPQCNLFRHGGVNNYAIFFHKLVLQDVIKFRETGKRERSKYYDDHRNGRCGLKSPDDPIFD